MVRVSAAVLFLALFAGCSREHAQWDREYAAVVERLQQLGAELRHDGSGHKRPVIGVSLRDEQVSDALLKDLGEIKKLQALSLEGKNVTDSSLKEVGQLKGLER